MRFLRWARRRDDVEDLASETMLRLLQNLQSGERVVHLEAYVRQIARNVLQEEHRRNRRYVRLLENPSAALPAPSDANADALYQCLERCKKDCLSRKEIRLIEAYYDGNSAARKKLATQMNLSECALRIHAFRVRRKLAECVRKCQDRGGNAK